ncbi:MAG TPA: site-specific integrase [Chloroflexia bacterium]|nr:site-specific integrase [Chloroflexia bacterium]
MRGRNGALVEGQPGTAAACGQINQPATVLESLHAHLLRQEEARLGKGTAYPARDFVFAGPLGEPLHASTVGKAFVTLAVDAGLPQIRFHNLPHTCATLMLCSGEHPKIVQERLYHSNISMTLERYSHVTPNMQRDAADRLDRLIQGAS